MPIRPEFKTYRERGFPEAKTEKIEFSSETLIKGLITDLDPKDIPDDSLSIIVNGIYVRNQLIRRNGLKLYTNTKPDSIAVAALVAFFHTGSGITFLRFTASSIFKATSTGWTAITGAGLNGTTADGFNFTVADNRLFFTNNGADVIQELDTVANTYAPLGDAPRYKYLASAFNRIIGANRRDVSDTPFEIGWSGDLNYSEWNPAVDISAGSTPLVNSPADTSDAITGLFSLSSKLCILREKSIWLATNLPSATNPFNFYVDVPRIGCDCPKTAALTPDGLVFYNLQQSSVYLYLPDSDKKVITLSDQIKRKLKTLATNPNNLFGSYNYDTRTYSLFIVSSTASTVQAYSYNFEDENWSVASYTGVTCVNDIDFAASSLTIDELTGIISALTGTTDELGNLVANASRFFGFSDGNICTQPLFDASSYTVNNIILTDQNSSDAFQVVHISKRFAKKMYELRVTKTLIGFTPFTTGIITLAGIKDVSLTVYTINYTVTSDMLEKPQVIAVYKPIRCRDFVFQLYSTNCMFAFNNYYIEAEVIRTSTR